MQQLNILPPDRAGPIHTGKLKVLHFYRTYYPDTQGGGEEVIRQICLGTAPLGVESRILTLSHNPDPAIVELPEAVVYRVKNQLEIASCSMGAGAIGQFRKLAAWADVIHCHFPWPFGDLALLLSLTGKPCLVTYHSDIVRQRALKMVYGPLQRLFLRRAERIVATSPNYLKTSPTLAKYAGKVSVIPIGLDEQHYPPPTPETLETAEKHYGRDFFLFVGVLRYYKGLHILLEAMVGAPYPVVICGSGPIEAELKAKARRLGLSNVVFAGHLSDTEKCALFTLCRAVVFPSFLRSEAFGVTLVEGALFGKPLISAEIGSGTSYVNQDKETGIVVEPGCPVSLRNAMDYLWSKPEEAQKMGAMAYQRYKREFTGKVMGQRYCDEYRLLCRQFVEVFESEIVQ